MCVFALYSVSSCKVPEILNIIEHYLSVSDKSFLWITSTSLGAIIVTMKTIHIDVAKESLPRSDENYDSVVSHVMLSTSPLALMVRCMSLWFKNSNSIFYDSFFR